MEPFKPTAEELDQLTREALDTILWAAGEMTDDDGNIVPEMWDKKFSVDDFTPETVAKMREELEDFIESNGKDLARYLASGRGKDHIPHDFILTADGHGVGFWDLGLGELGDRLTDACKPYGGEHSPYVGDDGKLYVYCL